MLQAPRSGRLSIERIMFVTARPRPRRRRRARPRSPSPQLTKLAGDDRRNPALTKPRSIEVILKNGQGPGEHERGVTLMPVGAAG